MKFSDAHRAPLQKYNRPQLRKFPVLRAVGGKKLFLLFLRSVEGFFGGQRFGRALLEFVHAAGGIHKFLRAGVKGMARVANADDDGLLGGARLDHVAAGATDFRVNIFRMDVRLHKKGCKTIICPRNDKQEFKKIGCRQTPPIHLRSSHTAFSEVRLRESKKIFAAAATLPFFKLLKASLALM